MAGEAERIGLILDCDGTLLDSIGAWHEAEAAVARSGGVALSKAERDELNTLTLPEAGTFFHERFDIGESAQDVVDRINEFMLDYYRERSEARPGALEFLRELRERGAAATVASSSPQAFLQAGLAHTGFLPLIDAVVSVDDVAGSKRDRAIFDHCRDLMGTDTAFTWGFDDSIYALRTMADAGYRTVGVLSSDLCGSHTEMAEVADLVVAGFEEFDAARFLQLVARG